VFARSPSVEPFVLNMSVTTMSNIPRGNHISPATSAIVPVKPRGATPTTVNAIELTSIVWPRSEARS